MRLIQILRTFTGLLVLLASPAAGGEPGAPADRIAVDIGKAPWSAVGRINNSAYGRCSAVLVRRDIAVTAAHCLYNPASRRFLQPASIHILFGFSKGRYGFHTTASEITIAKGYEPGGKAASASQDWAILRLAEAAPAAFPPMAMPHAGEPPASSVRAAGFAQERSEVLTATEPCKVFGGVEDALLVTNCPLSHGFSGGPMIDGATGELAGISVAISQIGARSFGIAVPASSIAKALPPAP
ncbi:MULTISPECIES: trypsin-like serine peptidase [unclassified Aureimonas]|uniref:trypsin-like serine peptidase n=1 Tax=unclassified Aureimonas TaxID=2615206 RepID=UPI0006F3E8EE|nr:MULTISPECIES: trypsin-like peptidase domain-containing protein [unclassified Aureimonas]KQT60681.1 hypothetical protein ASG54_24810 [Aureimonas sp. Leaf460]KQT68810.1 hypothetical protein ASG62_18330 [Aureimonas sp. Leaf427]